MLEALVAPLVDHLKWKRSRAVLATRVVVLLVGLLSALSYTGADLRITGERFLDLMDTNLGSLGLPVAGLAGGLVMAWAASRATTVAEINLGSRWPVGRLVLLLTRHAVPLGLLVTIALTVNSRFG